LSEVKKHKILKLEVLDKLPDSTLDKKQIAHIVLGTAQVITENHKAMMDTSLFLVADGLISDLA